MASAFNNIPNPQPVTVYEIQLEDDGSPSKERSYIRLPAPFKPYVLRLTIDAGSTSSKGGVFNTNFPLDGSPFERSKFHKTSLPQDFSKPIHIELPVTQSGAYEFFIEYTAAAFRVRSTSCYFNVDPILRLPRRTPILGAHPTYEEVPDGGKVCRDLADLPLDGIVLQSVIAKWMGPLSEWGPHLDLTRDRGYNMLHFTPLQERGASDSPYSIYDQLAFAQDLFSKPLTKAERESQLKEWIGKLRKEWGFLSLTDIVWNHTANNSPWLHEHPEAGYSPANSPHLTPALELDTALLEFSSNLQTYGLTTTIESIADLDAIMITIRDKLLPGLKLWEYYAIDVAAEKSRFFDAWKSGGSRLPKNQAKEVLNELSQQELVDSFARRCLPKGWKEMGHRSRGRCDIPSVVVFVESLTGKEPGGSTVEGAVQAFGEILDVLNVDRYREYDSDVEAILDNIKGRIKYQRLDDHGPKFRHVTKQLPLCETYFTRLPDNEKTAKHDPQALSLANNGWIWNANPLADFASASSRAYLRREVIVWGDCVKLRYGRGPEDSPFLWDHMIRYTELLASIFDGFRIDNCHSTPIHVGEFLLDKARSINKNLYVCAELFTGSEDTDVYFVKRLGINSLIREAMNGHDPKDQSRLLYIYGVGKPLGSMDVDCLSEQSTIMIPGESSRRPCTVTSLQGSSPHALMMDCTHDNESPMTKRTAQDALPTGALVTFCWSAIGSNKGFDDLYPKLLNLVTEPRKYEVYRQADESGIGKIKRLLNHLHTEMAIGGYIEGHFHQENEYIISHRTHPQTHQGYLVVAHCAFSGSNQNRGYVDPVRLRGSHAKFITGAELDILSKEDPADPATLKGLPANLVPTSFPDPPRKHDSDGSFTEIVIPDHFPPGSIMLFATWMDGLEAEFDKFCLTGAADAFAGLDHVDLNVILFRADGEERDVTDGMDGTYNVPGHGDLVYCGLEGWMAPLRRVMRYNDLGHAICEHLREGTWAMDYVVNRLRKQVTMFPNLVKPADWFFARFSKARETVPNFMRPKYFAMIINAGYKAARNRALEQCSDFVRQGHAFTHALAMTSLQMHGTVKSASISPNKSVPSLAAGLPHFASGWARCWGRDVGISMRGLFLMTGQFTAARDHIMAFCSTLKHGLMPNLLDSVRSPRFNSRDTPWWILQNIQDYIKYSPEGEAFLGVSVARRFPKDDTWVAWDDSKAYAYSSTVAEIVYEILQKHATGIHFREHNAGPNLDMQMRSEGFDVDISVDWSTGLILGGNEFNCGTWQDKMGESERAGTKGLPATPRDGSPIEIAGLLKSTLRWVQELEGKDRFPWKGVATNANGKENFITWKKWNDLLQESFERCYYVPSDPSLDGSFVIDPALVSQRGIYKDVYGTPAPRTRSDYQLRSNFPIAMAVAPELFTPQRAVGALDVARKRTVSKLGMKTLDKNDSDFHGWYDNSNDSNDRSTAKGWNYHQGPEWVWPLGYFLRAYLHFDTLVGSGKEDPAETFHQIYSILLPHRLHIHSDSWAGLPELTQEDGHYCHDSSRTQAWSSSTILDALEAIWQMQKV